MHGTTNPKISIAVLEVPAPFQFILTKVLHSSPYFQAETCPYTRSSRPTLPEGKGASSLTVIVTVPFHDSPTVNLRAAVLILLFSKKK